MLEPAVGSRLTNFMGILSQGLRIAPPEAPATGYMFGKVSTRTVASELPEVMIWGGLTCWESQAFGRDHISFHSEEQAITRPAASLFLQTSPNARQGITFRVLKQLTNRHRCLKLVSLGLLVVSQPTSSDSVSGGRSYAKHHGRQGLASSVSNAEGWAGPLRPQTFCFPFLPPSPSPSPGGVLCGHGDEERQLLPRQQEGQCGPHAAGGRGAGHPPAAEGRQVHGQGPGSLPAPGHLGFGGSMCAISCPTTTPPSVTRPLDVLNSRQNTTSTPPPLQGSVDRRCTSGIRWQKYQEFIVL